jgi:hypothetical protein
MWSTFRFWFGYNSHPGSREEWGSLFLSQSTTLWTPFSIECPLSVYVMSLLKKSVAGIIKNEKINLPRKVYHFFENEMKFS